MEHVWFVTQEELDDGSGAAKIKEVFASHAGTFPVYLSVDKDILSKEELDTNWDQGNVRVDELLSLAKDCLAGRKVLAVDLCGEPSANAPEAECGAASLVNQKLYGALAAKIED
jgi:arginase family enzyme